MKHDIVLQSNCNAPTSTFFSVDGCGFCAFSSRLANVLSSLFEISFAGLELTKGVSDVIPIQKSSVL